MLSEEIEKLEKEIKELKALLSEREAALPAHSVRPNQMKSILDLEDKIVEKEALLNKAVNASKIKIK